MIFTANSTFISVLYRFHIGPTMWPVSLQGFPFSAPSVRNLLPRISNLKLIEASLRAASQESRQHELLLWIESESHNRESDRSLQPSNPINNNFCFGFCIGLISVWRLLSRISKLKLMEASQRAPTQESRQHEFCPLNSISVWYRSGNSFPENRI